jgi:hypothetical protein
LFIVEIRASDLHLLKVWTMTGTASKPGKEWLCDTIHRNHVSPVDAICVSSWSFVSPPTCCTTLSVLHWAIDCNVEVCCANVQFGADVHVASSWRPEANHFKVDRSDGY